MTSVALAPNRLATLAVEVRTECGLADEAWNAAVQHAINAGNLLIEAKSLVRHGEWGPWLQDVGLPERTARNYMRLARNSGYVADLPTVSQAIAALTSPKEGSEPDGTEPLIEAGKCLAFGGVVARYMMADGSEDGIHRAVRNAAGWAQWAAEMEECEVLGPDARHRFAAARMRVLAECMGHMEPMELEVGIPTLKELEYLAWSDKHLPPRCEETERFRASMIALGLACHRTTKNDYLEAEAK